MLFLSSPPSPRSRTPFPLTSSQLTKNIYDINHASRGSSLQPLTECICKLRRTSSLDFEPEKARSISVAFLVGATETQHKKKKEENLSPSQYIHNIFTTMDPLSNLESQLVREIRVIVGGDSFSFPQPTVPRVFEYIISVSLHLTCHCRCLCDSHLHVREPAPSKPIDRTYSLCIHSVLHQTNSSSLLYVHIRTTPIIPTHPSTTISLIPRPQAVCITVCIYVCLWGQGNPCTRYNCRINSGLTHHHCHREKREPSLVCLSPCSRAIRIYDQSMRSCTGVCLTVSTVLFKAC